MSQGKDLAGMRFGKLIAVCPTEERKRGVVVWKCQCDCGNTAYVLRSQLTHGGTRSCGCLRSERLRAKAADLTGQRFGRLTVMDTKPEFYVAPSGGRYRQWHCRCDCGNTTLVRASSLISGRTSSCGCWQGGKSKYVNID